MAKIKIKNFGPITDGFTDNDGFINIDKVMIFIGGQGSGKSSIVKLISTLTWLEKELYKNYLAKNGNIKDFEFKKLCEFQSIQNYFKQNTSIEYVGDYLVFKYSIKKTEIQFIKKTNYIIPKITYIPAERNFLSVIEESDLEIARGLPKSLSWTLEEYLKACKSLIKPIPIHINDINFEYNKKNKISSITGEGFNNLKLSEASSGIQSVVPLIVVLYYLDFFIHSSKLNNIDKASVIDRLRLEYLEEMIFLNSELSSKQKEKEIKNLSKKILPQHLFTIIEEIEQNLFPESQKSILFSAIEFSSKKKNNKLILTTHSPYIIAYTTLAMKAFKVMEKANKSKELLDKINVIVPLNAAINPDDTAIYQIDNQGNVESIKSIRGLIKDDNYLNSSLEETNDLFNDLLDIEALCKQ